MINYSLYQIAKIVEGTLIGDGNICIKGVASDSRVIQAGALFVPFVGERVDGHSFVKELFEKGVGASLWQEGNPNEKPQGNLIVVKDPLVALQKLARAYRRDIKAKIIGVTGSSGKTSTKDIVSATLSGKYKTYKTKGNQNNELGVPLMILNIDDDADYGVIEMGVSDFGEMDLLASIVQPDITIISSIGPAHLAQFKELDNTAKEKCRINAFSNAQCYYNVDGHKLSETLESMHLSKKPISYGLEHGDNHASDIAYDEDGSWFVCQGQKYKIGLIGKHQILNAVGAISIASNEGLNAQEIQKGLNSIELTPHRLQVIKKKQAIIIDDSYNANPASMKASLDTIIEYYQNSKKIVVLGDMKELGCDEAKMHSDMAEMIDFNQFDEIYLIGQLMTNLHKTLIEKNIKSSMFKNNDEAVETLKKYLDQKIVIFFKASNSMRLFDIVAKLQEAE